MTGSKMTKPNVPNDRIHARCGYRTIMSYAQYMVENPGHGWRDFLRLCKDSGWTIVTVPPYTS
jgi:hypothetical protein